MGERFKIVGAPERRQELDTRMRFYNVRRVYFSYGDDYEDYVDIPEAQMTPENVQRVVSDLVDTLLAVINL